MSCKPSLPRGVVACTEYHQFPGVPQSPAKPMRDTMPKSPFLAALLLVAVASTASAQQPPTVRIRGTIEAVDGAMLSIKSRDGADMKVRTTDNVAVFGVAKTDLSEIKSGSYIGVT